MTPPGAAAGPGAARSCSAHVSFDAGQDGAGVPGGHPGHEAVVWRNRFIMLLDRAPMPIAIADTAGVVLMVNPAFAGLWRQRPGQLRGRDLLDLFDPRDKDQLLRIYEALRHGRRSRYLLPVTLRDAGQAPRDAVVTVDPVGDEPDEPPALLVTLREEEAAAPAPPARPAGVTLGVREGQVLALAAAGATNAAIARALDLTVDGVSYHLSRLCRRLGAPNRAALVARAYVLGVLDPHAWPPEPARGG
ncbi:PAS domain-containing protein [Streptomyces sp. SID5468]|nr:PAS domain-containing protein [Streptomyces sp. SID5468]